MPPFRIKDIWIIHDAVEYQAPLTKVPARIYEDGHAVTLHGGSEYLPGEYELTRERAIERCQADITSRIRKLEKRLELLRSIKVTAEE